MPERRAATTAQISTILIAACLLVLSVALYLAVGQERSELERVLASTARGHAAMLEQAFAARPDELGEITLCDSLSRFRDHLISAFVKTHSQIADFDEKVILRIGEVRNDTIIARTISPGESTVERRPFDLSKSEPMQRALRRESGIMEGLDSRGVNVIAAYRYIPSLGLGIVAKIDLAEARAPYLALAFSLIGLSGAITLIGLLLIRRATRPVINQLRAQNLELKSEIANRVSLEEALTKSFQSYRDLIENISDTAYEINARGVVTYISPVVTRVLGYQPEEVTGKHFTGFVHPSDLDAVLSAVEETLRGHSLSLDFRLLCADGGYKWVKSSAQAVTVDGVPTGLRGVYVDISEQKAAELALQRSERITRAITSAARDAVVLIDESGCVTFWNPAAEYIFGYSAEEAIGQPIHELVASPPFRDHIRKALRRIAMPASGDALGKTIEFEAMRRDLAVVPVELSLAATELDGVWHAVGLIRDISERKLAELALRESEASYRSLFKNMLEGIAHCRVIYDATGHVVDWIYLSVNGAFNKITGLTDAVGKRVSEILPTLRETNPELFIKYGRVAKEGQTEAFEMEIVPLGMILHITAYCPAPDEFVAVFEDVTERSKAERSLRDALDSLQVARDAADLGVWSLELADRSITCDQRTRELWGLAADEPATWDAIFTYVHADDHEPVLRAIERAVTPGSDGQIMIELRTTRKSENSLRWIAATGHVIYENGHPARLTGVVQDVTERRKAEQALRDSEQLFRTIMEHMIDAVFMTDADGYITYLSPSAEGLFGIPIDEIIGSHFTQWLRPDIVNWANREFIAQIESRRTALSQETILRNSGGSFIFAEMNSTVIVRDDKVIGTAGLLRDVTERRRADETLRNLRFAVEKSGEVIFMTSPQGVFTYVNPAFTELYGYLPSEVVDRTTPRILKSGELGPGDYAQFWKTLLSGNIYRHELTNCTKDGRQISVEVSVSSTIDESGEISGFLAVQRDITDRKAADRALRESEMRFRMVAESLNEGLAITSLDGDFVYLNRQLAEMCGYSVEELMGRPASIIIPDELRESVDTRTRRRASGLSEKYELQLVRKNGKKFWVEINASPYTDAQGNIIGALAAFADISDRKAAEAERLSLESQLRQAQKMEAIGTLAGGIAHDFNNILTPIMAYTEMVLLNVADDPVTTEDLRRVMEAAIRAKDLVRQILTFSRQTEHERYSISPAPIIKEAMKLMRASLPSTIRIVENIDIGDAEILADPTQIHQIMMNLCTNAAWAMSQHGGELRVSVSIAGAPVAGRSDQANLPPGRYIKLSVGDTGCGMDAATVSRIFEPFFTTKSVGEGTGLGLPVVHGIVKSYGGEIHVSSEPGEGTQFDLYFPLAAVSHQRALQPASDNLEGSERILLVDDEAEIAAGCARALERYGYHVTFRTSSIEALEAFKAHPQSFDLVVTDFTMPQLTGVELTRRIKGLDAMMPIVLMTGFSAVVNESNIRDFGIDAIIMKPVIGAELAAAVRKVIDERCSSLSSSNGQTSDNQESEYETKT